MGIQYRGRIAAESGPLSPVGVTGIQTSARLYRQSEATGSVLVRFTAQGATCFGVPATELLDRSVALEDLLGRTTSAELCERLCEAPDERARVAVVEEFLLNLSFASDMLVARAAALFADPRSPTVEFVAKTLGVSERQLERRFRNRVGVTPKQYARLSRFERAVTAARQHVGTITGMQSQDAELDAVSLTAVAQLAGYYDQSHFVREVRQFTGSTPSELLLPVVAGERRR